MSSAPSWAARFRAVLAASFLSFTGLAHADSLDVGVPVVLYDELAINRHHELVDLSVPCGEASGIIDPSQLVIDNEDGVEVATQWRVLTRWHGGPADATLTVKFALAKFLVDLQANSARTFHLRRRVPADGPPAQPAAPLQVGLHGQYGVIFTGPAKFSVDALASHVIDDAWIDVNADGQFANDEKEHVLEAGQSFGAFLVDQLNGVYLGCIGTPQWTVEEMGPLELVLRIDGRYQPLSVIPSIGRDFFKFTTRLTFTAASTSVKVEHVISNSYLDDPLGAMGFARSAIHLKMSLADRIQVEFGPDASATALISASPTATEEAFLYQDSDGGPNWNQPGTSFQGFRVWTGAPVSIVRPETTPTRAPIASGARGEGWMLAGDASKSVFLTVDHPWQNHPYALRALGDGSLIVDLWPAEYAGLHWLDDAQRKAHTFTMEVSKAGVLDPRNEAKRLANPLRPVVSPTYLRETLAWGDQGDLRDPKLTFAEMKAEGEHQLTDRLTLFDTLGNWGWVNFGEPLYAKNTHTTGSPRNRLTWFDHFVTSGARSWFELSDMFARHSMDLRTYHIDGFDKDQHPNAVLVEGLPAWPGTDMLGRNSIDPALAPHKVGIPTVGHGWNGFDIEHMMIDDLYEDYLLTGSGHALEALTQVGAAMRSWKSIDPTQPITSSRAAGWAIRALMKIYAVTGDPKIFSQADKLVTSLETFRGQNPSPIDGIVYHWLTRDPYGGGSHNMTQEYDCPWQIAVGIYGLAIFGRDSQETWRTDPIIADLSNYIIDYCVENTTVVDALACDDHLDFNPKAKNDGVNQWIASAFGIAYRVTGRPEAFQLMTTIFQTNKNGFTDSDEQYHWFHTCGVLLNE